jgi:predicted alpha-1,2-mannosidase
MSSATPRTRFRTSLWIGAALAAWGLNCGRRPCGNGSGVCDQEDAGAQDAGSPYAADPASLVNTLVGTTGGGNVFPGADYPFGMVQWSPDTSPDRSAGGGYEYDDSMLLGFSLTHISGPGCGAYGDVPILPMTGGLPSGDPGSHLEPFSHTGEVGSAGYYSVMSGVPSITTELTSTLHSAMARFTFPATSNANLLIKLLASQNGNTWSTAQIVGSNEVTGSTVSGGFCGAADRYTVYFDIVFDRPFTASQIVDTTAANGESLPNVVFLTFDTTTNSVLQAKVGVSFVSVQNARGNWNAENPDGQWNFDGVRTAAHQAWNSLLGQIQIGGGTASEQELFYTSLYHALLHPNVFSDTNGQYIGFDSNIYGLSPGQSAQYANYSGWDIYHSQVQLSALVAPRQMSDSAQSMLNDAAQNFGRLPKWALANAETYIMVGDPADGILGGYYAFGARNFDTSTALTLMLAEATQPNDIRPGLAYYESLGYLPDDGIYGCCNFYGSVSTLLEYAQADFALSQFASALGDQTDAQKLLARAQNWQNVFNPANGLFNPRLLNGSFVSGFGLSSTQGMVEGSASQYRWVEPFDRQALLTAMGGAAVANPALNSFFANLNDCAFNSVNACLTNEMDLGTQFWGSYTGQPWESQDAINRLRTQVFQDEPAEINNNDDLGAESSMLVWSMLGMYPDYPGSAILTINGPEFPFEAIHLQNGNVITINAPGASASTPYVQSLQIDDKPATSLYLDPSILETGGTLDFTMGASPNTAWGTGAGDTPPSYGTTNTWAIGFASPVGPIVITPGGTTTAEIGVQSTRDHTSQTISWALASDGGVSVTPTSGQIELSAGGQATQPLTLLAGSIPQGAYAVAFDLKTSNGVALPNVVIPVTVAAPGAYWPYFNNAGVSDDSNMSAANYDGEGFSYSAEALAGGGVTPGNGIPLGGFTFAWPNNPSGNPDNVIAGGQTIQLAPLTGKTSIGLIGSATNAGSSGAQGTLTVTYSDGTSQRITISFSDWTLGGGSYMPVAGDTIAVTAPYRNCGCGAKDNTATYLYAFSALLTSSQPLESITLPADSTGGQIHIFDVEFR